MFILRQSATRPQTRERIVAPEVLCQTGEHCINSQRILLRTATFGLTVLWALIP